MIKGRTTVCDICGSVYKPDVINRTEKAINDLLSCPYGWFVSRNGSITINQKKSITHVCDQCIFFLYNYR